jgi:energy-coupling factor transport system permease protein
VLRPQDAVFVAGTVLVCAAAIAVSVTTGAWTPTLSG